MSERTKINHFRNVVRNHDGKKGYEVQVETQTYKWDNQEPNNWDRKPQTETTYEPLTAREGSKQVVFKVIERRSIVNPNTFQEMSALFLRTISMTVKSDYPECFLKSINGSIIVQDFESGFCRELSCCEILGQTLQCLKVKIGKGITQINGEQAAKMLKSHEVFPYALEILGSGESREYRVTIPALR